MNKLNNVSLTNKYNRLTENNKFGIYSQKQNFESIKYHHIKYQINKPNPIETTSNLNQDNSFTFSDIYIKPEVIPELHYSITEPKLKTIVNVIWNKHKLDKLINAKKWN